MLAPYRVLDCTDDRGHLAGLMLAQLGAEVILVEPPAGSPARRRRPFAGDDAAGGPSLWHAAYNRGKRSVVLDLTTDAGRRPPRPPGCRRRRAAVVGPPGRPALRPPRAVEEAPGARRRGPHTVRPHRAQGRLARERPHDLRLGLPAGAHRRHRPTAAALRRPPGLRPRLGRPGRGRAARPQRARPFRPGPGRRRLRPDLLPAGVVRLRPRPGLVSARRSGRSGEGINMGSFKLRWGYPAADGEVSITLLFGAAFKEFTPEPLPLDLGGGRLRRGHPGQAVGGPHRPPARRPGAGQRARPPRRDHRRLHREADEGGAAWPRPVGAGCCWPRWPRSARSWPPSTSSERGVWDRVPVTPGGPAYRHLGRYIVASGTPLFSPGPAPDLGADTDGGVGRARAGTERPAAATGAGRGRSRSCRSRA